jgi:hypothetical protein
MASKFYQQLQAKKKPQLKSPYAGTVTGVKPTTPTKSPYDTPSFTRQAPSSTTTPMKSPYDTPSFTRQTPMKSPYDTPSFTGSSSKKTTPTPQPYVPPTPQRVPQPQQQVPQQQAPQFDYAQMSKMIADQYAQNLPPIPQYQPYQSQLDPQIMETLNQIRNYKQFSYDPASDEALKVAQTQAAERVRQDMAKRGRLFDPYAAQQEQIAMQGLIPDYYRFARQGYESDRGYQGQVLGALQGVDQAQYGRYGSEYDRARQGALQGQRDYREAYDVGQAGAEGAYQRGFEGRQEQRGIEDVQRNQEIQEFGTPLSTQARDLRQAYLDIPTNIKAQLQELGNQPGGYATTINQLMQTDPTNPMIQQLQAMRANKVLSDPELLKRYGREYGMETGAITEMGEAGEQQKLMDELEVIKGKLQNEKYVNEISKIQAEAKRIQADSAYKDAQTVVQEYKALQEKITAAGLPAKLKSEINENISQTAANYARGEASKASAAKSYAGAETEREKTKTERETRAGKIAEQEAKVAKMTKEEKKSYMADDIADIQNLPTVDAIRELEQGKRAYIDAYGINGYKDLWDMALAGAIQRGEAKTYKGTYGDKKEESY